jgi:hypothetical protein
VCDKELLGKTLDKELGFTAKAEFYGKQEIEEQELKRIMKEVDSANLLGKKSVSVALKENFAQEKNIIKINNVPHLQIYFIKGENI